MNWSNKSLSFLDLTDAEIMILHAFEQAKTFQEVSREADIPRTTIAFMTKNLMRRNLVIPVKNGKRFRYVSITEAQLHNNLQAIIGEMSSVAAERKGAHIKLSRENEFTIHTGLREIIPAHARIASLHLDQRVYAIQPNKSWMNMHKKLSPTQLIGFNESIKKNHIILEAILQENAYKLYGAFFKSDPRAIKAIAASFINRMADYATVPERFFDYHAELWLFKTTVLIINWEEEVAIEMVNPNIMGFFKDMFELVKASSAKIDHNQAMRDLLS
jgi:predicted transcriptional regulator